MAGKLLLFVALLGVSTRALDLSGLPSCGKTCFSQSLSSSTGCSSSDVTCLCNDYTFGYNLGTCLGLQCSYLDTSTSVNWLYKTCLNVVTATNYFSYPIATGTATTLVSRTSPALSFQTGYTPYGGSSGSSKKKSGLASGAKIGLGVGIPLAILLIAGAVYFAFFLGRKKKTQTEAGTAQAQAQAQDPTTATAPYQPPPGGGVVMAAAPDKMHQAQMQDMSTVPPYTSSPHPAMPQPAPSFPQPQGVPMPQSGMYEMSSTVSPVSALSQPDAAQAMVPTPTPPPYMTPQGVPQGPPPGAPQAVVYEAPSTAPTNPVELPGK